MATGKRQQQVAAERTAHLIPENVRCRYCGEASTSGSFKSYAHKFGPTKHLFIAARYGDQE